MFRWHPPGSSTAHRGRRCACIAADRAGHAGSSSEAGATGVHFTRNARPHEITLTLGEANGAERGAEGGFRPILRPQFTLGDGRSTERRFTARVEKTTGWLPPAGAFGYQGGHDGRKEHIGPGRSKTAGASSSGFMAPSPCAELALKEFCLGACVAGIRAIPGYPIRLRKVNQ